MKIPKVKDLGNSIKSSASQARDYAEPLARKSVKGGGELLKTKVGKRIATGALAGGAIGFALPFATVTAGAILGAGALLMVKSLKDQDD